MEAVSGQGGKEASARRDDGDGGVSGVAGGGARRGNAASGLGKEGREDGGGEKAEELHGASEDRLYPEGGDGGFGGGLRRILQAGGGVSARKQHCNR